MLKTLYMQISILLSSKNQKSIVNFLKFWEKALPKDVKKSVSILVLQKNNKHKIERCIPILTSPHINKGAQSHYGYKIFSKNLIVFSYKPRKFFFIFKKIQASLFPEVQLRLVSNLNFKNLNKITANSLNPYNFTFFNFTGNEQNQKLIEYKTINYLKLLDFHGELKLKSSKVSII